MYAAQAVTFGFPILFAFIGGAHQDHRFRRGNGGILPVEKDAVTSNVPFVALLAGHQSWSVLASEMKWLNASVAVTVAAALATRRFRAR